MGIIRSPRPQTNYTVLANSTIRDSRLSWKARGILAYLLSLPDNWRTSADNIAKISTEGRRSILAGLKELEEIGYIRRQRHQDERGRWQTTTVVYDTPSPKCGFATSENRTPQERPNNKDLAKELEMVTLMWRMR